MDERSFSYVNKSFWKFLSWKLRALFLLETDFNALHKIKFNGKITPSPENLSTMPQEIIGSRKSQAATCLALSKKTDHIHLKH